MNGGGGWRREVSIISHRRVTRSYLKQERSFFCGSVSTFLQLVVAVPFLAVGKKKLDENYARNDELCQKLWELLGETPLDERGGECSSSLLGVYKISDFGLTFALSLGLIIPCGQSVSGHVVQVLFAS